MRAPTWKALDINGRPSRFNGNTPSAKRAIGTTTAIKDSRRVSSCLWDARMPKLTWRAKSRTRACITWFTVVNVSDFIGTLRADMARTGLEPSSLPSASAEETPSEFEPEAGIPRGPVDQAVPCRLS